MKIHRTITRWFSGVAAVCLLLTAIPGRALAQQSEQDRKRYDGTQKPIKHVVIIFQENVSFDHYFGTYPFAKPNLDGSVFFDHAKEGTPRVNGLLGSGLLTRNPNLANPFRIDRSV